MRIFYFADELTALLDVVIWVIFHLNIGYWTSKLPVDIFDPQKPWYLTRPWEKSGEIYQELFKVKDWKRYIPSGAAVYKNTYEVKHINTFDVENVKLWLKESCRSEFCHWVMILPGFLFFLWNSTVGGWIMMAYAVLNNLVPIVMQRYNRPRVRKLLARLQKESIRGMEPQINLDRQQTFSHSY